MLLSLECCTAKTNNNKHESHKSDNMVAAAETTSHSENFKLYELYFVRWKTSLNPALSDTGRREKINFNFYFYTSCGNSKCFVKTLKAFREV